MENIIDITTAHIADKNGKDSFISSDRIDDIIDKVNHVRDVIPGSLSTSFALLDPSLATFHNDMRRAALQLAHAKKTGQNIDIALWRFETAESAYQTRLYEVRKNSIIEKINADGDTDAKKELHNLTMQQRMNDSFNLRRQQRAEEKRRKEEKSEGGFFFYFMLGIAIANMNAQRIAREMEASRLQTAFFNARTA